MKRFIGTGLFVLVLSTLAVPSAHAIRPELLPAPNQITQVKDVQTAQTQPTAAPIAMKPAQANPATQAEKMTQSEDASFEHFEQLYHDTYGS
jgi:hypothetical protein